MYKYIIQKLNYISLNTFLEKHMKLFQQKLSK